MAEQPLNIALIQGPMYKELYETLPGFTCATGIAVEIGFHGTHPELNAHLASLEDVPYHLVSTHTKYAPSQRRFLEPLDSEDLNDFFPALVEMATIDGEVYGVPRNLDVKLLHYRHDKMTTIPESWNELCETARALSNGDFFGFVFTGKDAGLFGMFFELVEMGGAPLFPKNNVPELDNAGGRWALETIRELYRSGAVPAEVKDWHYDQAHQFFRDGHAAMICDWPGYYGAYCATDSKVRNKFGLARMPAGPRGLRRAYAGAHLFALTKRGIEEPGAHELLRFLTAPRQQLREARAGSVPVRRSVMEEIREENNERWELLEDVIAHDLVIPPRIDYYPEIEEILWRRVRAAMTGEMSTEAALSAIENKIGESHHRHGSSAQQHAY